MTSSATLAPLAVAQLPRVDTGPAFSQSSGDEAVGLAKSAGLDLDVWQAHALRQMLGEREDGRWSAFEVGVLVARQNGKGGILEARELAGLFLFGEKLIMHSAHEFKTAQEAFLRIKTLIENTDAFRKRCKKPRTSHGEEGFELLNGQRLRFVARSRNSGRGFSGDCTILDEAQELSSMAIEALMPTMSARPNPQMIYTGTVPGPENDAEHWTKVRDRGRKGTSQRLRWMEWNIAEKWKDLDDRDAWRAANPSLATRLTEEFIAGERESMSDRGFARERLSLWADEKVDAVIDLELWGSLTDSESQLDGRISLAVECPVDMRTATISAVGRRPDGRWHVEIVDRFPGTSWVPTRLGELVRKHNVGCVVIDPSSAAGALIPDVNTELETSGLEVTKTSAQQYAAACGDFYGKATQDGLRHLGDQILKDALEVATWRPLSNARAWNRKETGDDISALVAATLAAYGLSTMEEEDVPEDPWGGYL